MKLTNKTVEGKRIVVLVMITPIHRVPRLRIGERPPDMEISCEYGNKQSRTKSQVALQQGIVPGSCPAQVSGEDFG